MVFIAFWGKTICIASNDKVAGMFLRKIIQWLNHFINLLSIFVFFRTKMSTYQDQILAMIF